MYFKNLSHHLHPYVQYSNSDSYCFFLACFTKIAFFLPIFLSSILFPITLIFCICNRMNYLKLKSGQGMPQLEIFQQFTIAYRVNSKVPSLLLKTLSSFPQRLSQHILCLVPLLHSMLLLVSMLLFIWLVLSAQMPFTPHLN